MSNHKLAVLRTLGMALRAPFDLESASWKALLRPLLAVASAWALIALANYLRWREMGAWVVLVPLWIAMIWLALDFQRQLLLGAEGSRTGPQPWRRYGLYLLVVGVVCLLLAFVIGLLMYWALPAMTFFMMAINSPNPWLATGTFLLWAGVILAAAYPVMRLSLALPAVAVSHDVTLARLWRITRGNGLRLLTLLILIPGLIDAALFLAFGEESRSSWILLLGFLLDIYFALAYLSLIAFAYQALSDQPLPADRHRSAVIVGISGSRILKPVGLVTLVGVAAFGLWDAVYRVEPGESAIVSRLGDPQRVESEAGLKAKMPFVEQTRVVPEHETHTYKGENQFLTMDKKVLPLTYEFHWRVADGETFLRSMAGETRIATIRVGQIAHDTLRNEVIKLRKEEVADLFYAGKVQYRAERQSVEGVPFTGVIEHINSKIADMGIEVVEWQMMETGHSD